MSHSARNTPNPVDKLPVLRLVRENPARSGLCHSAFVSKEKLPDAAQILYEAGYHLEDICGLDVKEGALAVYHFDHFGQPGRIALRALAPREAPEFPSIAAIFQGAEWHERECADFYGYVFSGNPNPMPLLLPEDMAHARPLSKAEEARAGAAALFASPEQDVLRKDSSFMLLDPARQEVEATSPIPQKSADKEGAGHNRFHGDMQGDGYTMRFEKGARENTLILNMGPQHPSTHGVLRILLELDGEYVIRAEPVLGYLHRMHEKMGEVKSPVQYINNMGRVDYLHAMAWNWAYVGAAERLAGMEVPERAEYLRVIVMELNRIASHLVWWGAYLLDLGAFTPILYAFDDREKILDILQEVSGSRLTYAYFRIGGVAADGNRRFFDLIREFIPWMRKRLPMYHTLVTGNVILKGRLEGIGVLDADICNRYGATGPVARGSGIRHDARVSEGWSIYDRFSFAIPVYGEGCCMARYMVRLDEIEESLKIIEQAVSSIPDGPILPQKPFRVTAKLPPGEAYCAVEGARGKIGVWMVSDGGKTLYRIKLRAPGFSNLSLFAEAAKGVLLADAVAILGSLDLVIPEIDR